MDVADYLNCSLDERNSLLLAAQLAPVEAYHTGSELARLVALATEAAHPLPMPWMMINRDWRILLTNVHLLALYSLSAEQIAYIEPERFNVLDLLFDPRLPFHPRVRVDHTIWERMALLTVLGFRLANRLCTHENWYRHTVDRLMETPDFGRIWSLVNIDRPAKEPPGDVVLAISLPNSTTVGRLRPLLISSGYFQFEFPRIVGFVPADAPTRAYFDELGLPFPQRV
jgi:hypothetical protein